MHSDGAGQTQMILLDIHFVCFLSFLFLFQLEERDGVETDT